MKYQKMTMLINTKYFRELCVVIFLGVYLVAGIYTELKFMERKFLPETLLEDFAHYERALNEVLQGQDPYANRYIGQAYLYPTTAFLVIEIFSHIRPFFLKVSIYSVVNIILLGLMIVGVAHNYKYPFNKIWYWFVLCLGFSPFFELLHIGQINMIPLAGMTALFLFEATSPLYSGTGIVVGIMTKVSPAIFIGYLVFNKRWKVILIITGLLSFISFLAIWRYGLSAFLTYPDVFQYLLQSFPISWNSHSFVSKILIPQIPQFEYIASRFDINTQYRLMAIFNFLFEHCQQVHRGLSFYLLIIYLSSGILMFKGKQAREPFFIVTSFVMVFSSNILWYHHYVFLLLSLLIWMGWQQLKTSVIIWCFLGLFIMQIDRHGVTYGLLIHSWGHLSLLCLLLWQIRHYIICKKSSVSLATSISA